MRSHTADRKLSGSGAHIVVRCVGRGRDTTACAWDGPKAGWRPRSLGHKCCVRSRRCRSNCGGTNVFLRRAFIRRVLVGQSITLRQPLRSCYRIRMRRRLQRTRGGVALKVCLRLCLRLQLRLRFQARLDTNSTSVLSNIRWLKSRWNGGRSASGSARVTKN